MSTTIDSKVVEMKFDNSKFESNVKQTMSTLDKLKASLAKISGKHATLDVDTSSTNKGILSVGNAVDTVSSKFNALEAVAFGALAKIGSQALVAGENLVKSLSVDNIAAGWSKYDEKTSSVQTLVNSTGKSVEEINKYLDQLMWYSDETSYSFTEMTSALAQMTSTGGDIDKLIPTITGIANATAYAGKTGEAFNHTIRNITQSYNAGYLQLMDWKSLNLAGTSSKQLTEQLIKAAEELGTVQKGFLTIENFAEHLKDKNITSDVMDLAFSRFSAMSQEAYKLVQSGEFDTASEAIEAIADDFDNLASRAFKSAQEAKTFAEAIDATKDAVSSGWMNTFEIIFGNYEQAKVLWTDIANRMWDFFAGGAEGRNAQLTKIMGSNFDNVTAKIAECGIESEEFEKQLERVLTENNIRVDTIKDQYGSLENWLEQSDGKYNHFVKDTIASMAYSTKELSDDLKVSEKNIEDFHKVIDKMSKGKIKNAATAIKQLEKANIKGAEAQEMVNKFYESGGKKVLDLQVDARKLEQTMLDLNKAQVSSYGYTEEQMEALQELARESRLSNTELGQLIDTINRPAGREMLLNSLFNVLDSFESIVAVVKDAFTQIFPPTSALTIQNVIANIEKLTARMKDFFTSEKNADKLKRTFKGLFAVLDIVKIVFKDIGKILLSVIEPIFGKVNFKVLDLTASLGDNLVKIRDWIKANDKIGVITAWLSNKVEKAVTVFKSWTKEGGLLNNVFKVMSKHLVEIKDAFGKWLDGLIESEDKPKYIIDSLVSAFEDGIPRFIEAAGKAIDELIDAIKRSTDEGKFNEAGESALQSFINGFKNEDGLIFETFKEIGQKLLDRAKELPWEKIFAVGLSLSMIGALKHVNRYMDKILDTIAPLQGILKNASGILKSVSATITNIGKAVNKEATGDMALKFAEAVAILVGAITVLAVLPDDQYRKAQDAAILIVGIMAALAMSMKWMISALNVLAIENPAVYLSIILGYIGLIGAITVFLGAVTAMIAIVSKEEVSMAKGMAFLVVALAGLGALIFEITQMAIASKDAKMSIAFITTAIKAIGAFMLEAAIAMRIVGTLDDDAYARGVTFLVAMGVFIGALMFVAHLSKEVPARMAEFGKAMQSIGVAMILAALSLKIIGTMDEEALKRGIKFFKWFGIFLAAMVIITDNRGISESIEKFGKLMTSIGLAMILTAVSLKIIGTMSGDELAKGIIFMTTFFGFVIAMTLITNEGKRSIEGFAKLMRSLGVALILMSVAVKILGGMDVGSIIKGEAAVAGLMTMLWLLMKSMKGMEKEAPKIAVTLIAASLCIAILAGIVFLVGQLSPETLKKGVATVGALTIMVAALIAVTRLAQSTPDMPKVLLQITLMIAMLVASIAILVLISDDVSQILGTAEALALVLAALGGVMVATSKIKIEAGMWKTIALIGALLAEVALVLGLLSKYGGDAKSMIASAQAISEVLLAISVASIILSKVSISPTDVATMALMGTIVLELGVILGALNNLGLNASIEQAIALGILINSLAIALIPLGEAGKVRFEEGLKGIGLLEALIAATALTIEAIGAVFNVLDKEGVIFNKGCEILVKVGETIGGFIGGIITGFGQEILTLLPLAGTALSSFYDNAKIFIDGMSELKPEVTAGAEALGNAILKLTAGEALQLLIGAFTGGSALSADVLKQSFTALGEGIKAFSEQVSEFTEDDVNRIGMAAEAAQGLSDFVNKLPTEGGLKGKILGSPNFSGFVAGLKDFGPALSQFAEDTKDLKTDAIKNAATAAQGLADLAASLPNAEEETIKGWLMGEKINLQKFSQQLWSLADGLVKFYARISEGDGIDNKSIEKATKSAQGLADLAASLPKTDGLFNEWFGGTMNLEEFGSQLNALGEGLKTFSNSAKGIILESMNRAVTAVKDLADIAIALGSADFGVFGDDTLKDLGEDLPGLGQALVSFNASISTLSGGGASNMGYAIDNLHKIVDAVIAMQGVDYEYIYSFKDALNSLAEFDMQGLVNKFAVEGVENVATAGLKLASSIKDGLSKGTKDIVTTAGMVMTSILNELHLHYHYFHDSGFDITSQMRSGLRMGEAGLVYETKGIVLSAQRSINDYYQYFVTAGAHLMNGLLEGMNSKEDEIMTRAGQIAAQTLAVMQSGLEEKSPSKATERMGRYLDEGLINGMKKYSRQVYSTAETLSTKTLDGFSKSIDQIYEVIDADLNPVITPTINLDYVKQGVSDINSMFNAKSLNANAELQNGVDMNGAGGPTISFTQINNSPKALSRIDIYRQTRNQIAQMKGALN